MSSCYDRMDRREALGKIGCGFSALAVGGLVFSGIRGCIRHADQETRDGYERGGEQLNTIAQQYFPGLQLETGRFNSARAALAAADKALECYGQLLQVPNPFGSRHPLINSIDAGFTAPDSYADLAATPQYNKTEELCRKLRNGLAGQILSARGALVECQRHGDFAQDPVSRDYLTRLVPRLDILAARMREGKLMTGNNVLQWSNKFGTFQELIGQAEHYSEACAEIKALREHLGPAERTGTES